MCVRALARGPERPLGGRSCPCGLVSTSRSECVWTLEAPSRFVRVLTRSGCVYMCMDTLGVLSGFVHASACRVSVNEFLVCHVPMGPGITFQVVFVPLDPLCVCLCEYVLSLCSCH